MEEQKTIKVFRHQRFLDYTTRKRADRLVEKTKEACWISEDAIMLIGGRKQRSRIKADLLAKNGRRCYICGRMIPEDRPLTLDHIIPKSNQGTDTELNCGLCCSSCNREKKDMSVLEFVSFLREKLVTEPEEYSYLTEDRLRYLEVKYKDFSLDSMDYFNKGGEVIFGKN